MSRKRPPSKPPGDGQEASPNTDGPKLPTPEMEDSPLDLPPPDPIVALQVVGEGWELPLSPEQHNFALGSLQPPAVDLSLAGRKFVTERHAFLSRRGNVLTVTDNRSRNGTFFGEHRDQYGEIKAGESFRVADVRLLALDERLRQLRKYLQYALGYDAHERVDQALADLADKTGPGLLLVGPPHCEQREIAQAIHVSTGRRHNGFVVAEPPLRHNAEEVALLRRGRHGTIFVDLDVVQPLAFFVRHLFGTTYQPRPIIAARSYEQAQDALGIDETGTPLATRLRIITLRPLADRRSDIPSLADELLKRDQYPHTIRRIIGDAGLANVIDRHAWKDNFDDLRDVLRICRGLYEGGKTQAAAAELLGLSPAALSERLKRWGIKWPPPDGQPAR